MSNAQSNSKPVTGPRLLPKGFSPSIYEVIIGRGRKVANHSGNERFHELIYSEIRAYSLAKNKTAKSIIIFRVLQQIQNGSPQTGGFVKKDSKTKRWFAVEDGTARTTIAQTFRDALSSSYRSSKQFKQQRRWNRKTPSINRSPVPEVEVLPKLPGPPPVPQVAPAPRIADIRPKMPISFSAFSSFPAFTKRPSPGGPIVGTQLGDILNSALETAALEPAEMHFPHACNTSMKAARTHHRHPLACGEKKCTNEFDLDTLWDTLGVQTTNGNPFDPTPISPEKDELTCKTSVALRLVEHQQIAGTHGEPKEEKDKCGTCWENKIQEQIEDSCFWQDGEVSNDLASGFSLRTALSL